MAAYNKFDPRLESLVVETRTIWSPDVQKLAPEDREWLSRAIHHQPSLAGKINYDRVHTGFAREITVTTSDIERLYRDKFGAN